MIEKQRYIIDFTLSALLRRKGKNITLLVSYTLVVALLASVMFLTHSLRTEASYVLQGSPPLIVQRLVAGRFDNIPVEYGEKIREFRGVESVNGRLWGYYFDSFAGANYTVMATEDMGLESGSITVGEGIARIRRIAVGDMFPVTNYSGETMIFSVAGVLASASSLVASDLILMPEKDFRTLFNISPGYVTDLVVAARNSRELPTIARKTAQTFPDTRPILRDEILRTYDALFSWRSGILIVILSTVIVAFLIFSWDRASGLSAEEKYEIGILKALGWDTSDILMMKFWEGASVSFTSFLGGLILAYIHVFFASATLFTPVLKGWSVLYPDFRLVPVIEAFQIATLFFLSVVPYTVATIIPVWRAATVDPDSVMRAFR